MTKRLADPEINTHDAKEWKVMLEKDQADIDYYERVLSVLEDIKEPGHDEEDE